MEIKMRDKNIASTGSIGQRVIAAFCARSPVIETHNDITRENAIGAIRFDNSIADDRDALRVAKCRSDRGAVPYREVVNGHWVSSIG
jgi:hypothetical protein